jgi:hypothetical protein
VYPVLLTMLVCCKLLHVCQLVLQVTRCHPSEVLATAQGYHNSVLKLADHSSERFHAPDQGQECDNQVLMASTVEDWAGGLRRRRSVLSSSGSGSEEQEQHRRAHRHLHLSATG